MSSKQCKYLPLNPIKSSCVKSFFCFLGCILIAYSAYTQPTNDDCVNATHLCPSIVYTGQTSNASLELCPTCADGLNGTGAFCFNYNNTVWYTFTTNDTGGNASATISSVNCLTGTGNDTELQAFILSATTPCDATTYTIVSNCVNNGTGTFNLNASGLLPNTTYYILVDGDSTGAGIVNPAACSFQIMISGSAVEVDVQTTIIDETCGASDGQIQITSVSGGQSPYQFAINGGAFQAGPTFNGLNAGAYIISTQDANNCQVQADTVLVNLLSGPQITSQTINAASCNASDGSIDITSVISGNPAYNFSINGSGFQASSLFSNLSAGTYVVVVSDQQNCLDSISIVVPNASGISATATSTPSSCGTSNGSITVNTVGGTNPISYSINGGASQTSPNFTNLASGVYTIEVTDGSGCTFTLNGVSVNENPINQTPGISITASSSVICVGDNVIFTANSQNAGSNPNYNWFLNGVSVQNGSSSTYSNNALNQGDQITCILTSNDPCITFTTITSNQINMTVNPIVNPTVTLSSNTLNTCSNVPVNLTATENGCTGTSSYQWMLNGIPILVNTTGVANLYLSANSTVSVNLTCNDACAQPASSNVLNITVTPIEANAGPNQVIATGQSTQLQGSGGGTYTWAPSSSLSSPNSQNPIANPGSTTTYTLIVTNNGCTDTSEVTVFVTQPINIPNTFTPNGDGVNDTWTINGIERFPNCKVTVYDRWGQRVYNSIGYNNNNAWDGTNKGLSLPASTYYYVIDLNSGASNNNDVYSGSITVIL